MTPLITISFELSLKNKLGFFILLSSYISTAIYLIFFSLSDLILSLAIIVYFWLISQIAFNIGKYNFATVSLVVFQEILMSLLYYTIVNENLVNALYSLYFYGTDIPSFSLSLTQIVVPAVLEVVNSFMFFLMIFPEIAYLSYKFRNYDVLLISLIVFAGPNIASEMTHSILPLPYDPIREASVLELVISLVLTIYFSYRYIKGKISLPHYILFILASFLLSISELYYSITINEIPYAVVTLVIVGLLFYYLPRKEIQSVNRIKYFALLPAFSQIFFGTSIVYFYGLFPALYALSIIPFIVSFLPIFFYSHKS